MASYNKKEDKIKGCKKYSPLWWHEEGHRVFANSKNGSTIQVAQKFSLIFLLITLTFKNNCLSILYLIIFIGIEIGEEIFAWRYAFKNKNKWKKQK